MFDSGVGGVSVLRAVRDALPSEDIFYVADSGHAPYGDRTPEFIQQRAFAIVEFLIEQGAKTIVVACNTATAAAAAPLRERLTLPIVAMEPAVKSAATTTRTGVVGVLATTRTLASASFARLVDRYAAGAQVLIQPCPGLVEQVERGALETDDTRALVERFVAPLLAKGADTLVLGCTHYPFLRRLIEDAAGPGVSLFDPAEAVAREVKRRLTTASLLAPEGHAGQERFWTSGPPDQVEGVIRQLWRKDVRVERLPSPTVRT